MYSLMHCCLYIGRTTTTFYLFVRPSTGENLVKYVRKLSTYMLLSSYIDADVDLHSSTTNIVWIGMSAKKNLQKLSLARHHGCILPW